MKKPQQMYGLAKQNNKKNKMKNIVEPLPHHWLTCS